MSNYTMTSNDYQFEYAVKTRILPFVEYENQKILTPILLCFTMLNRKKIRTLCSKKKKKILVVNNVEFLWVLDILRVDMSQVWYSTNSKVKADFVEELFPEVQLIRKNILDWKTKLKFDVVVGNPPYQDDSSESTNTKSLYTEFVEKSIDLSKKYVYLIIPSKWMGKKSNNLRKFLFKGGHLIEIEALPFDIFKTDLKDVRVGPCLIFWDCTKNVNETKITDRQGTVRLLDLTKVNEIPLQDIGSMDLLEKFGSFKNMGYRWMRGSLNLNKVIEQNQGVKFITNVGRLNESFSTVIIDSQAEQTGFGKHKICFANVGDNDRIGPIKICRPEHVGGHSVVFMTTNSLLESKNLKSYLGSNVVKFIVRGAKSSTPNSKTVFSKVPDIDLSKKWTNKQLYKRFNLDDDEIEFIEESIKTRVSNT